MLKYFLFYLVISLSANASEYCILRIDKLAARSVEITKTCNGVDTDLFYNNGARDRKFSKISSLLSSYPLERVDDKVESFALSVFLKQGFSVKRANHSDQKKSFILIK